jgi:hypothetical protein
MLGGLLGRYLRRYLANPLITAIATATFIVVAAVFITRPQVEVPHDTNPSQKSESIERTHEQGLGLVGIGPEGWTAIFTAVLALFTGVLTVVSFVQIKYLTRADRTAARTAKAARDAAQIANRTLIASQRAWLRVNVSATNQPITLDQNGASTVVSFMIINVGNTPAINITCNAWLLALYERGPSPIQEQLRLCAEIRSKPFYTGFTLFPGERFPESSGHASFGIGLNLSQDEVNKAIASNQSGIIALYVVGCVDYTFPADENTHHQTGFIYRIRKVGGEPIRPQGRNVPAGTWTLAEELIGQGRYAD